MNTDRANLYTDIAHSCSNCFELHMSSHSFMQIDFDKNLRAASNAIKMWDSRGTSESPKAYADPRSDEEERR